ncbi:gamma-glutamylcyclotransferase family protein [Streptomyces nojiriensis]|uniref:gamma-glutamylcyclotransferase family protein n=1 Tax=Streptomyces nojiriensis TaxID=66374 RepID=UPI00365588E2
MLFCYGTLQFDAVLHALLSRVPERHPDSAPGWRPAALADRQYPGLVAAADAVTPGLLLTEWGICDAFEDTLYDLREVTLASGRRAWAYIRTEDEARPHDGDAALFETEHLAQYATRCGRIAPALAGERDAESRRPRPRSAGPGHGSGPARRLRMTVERIRHTRGFPHRPRFSWSDPASAHSSRRPRGQEPTAGMLWNSWNTVSGR